MDVLTVVSPVFGARCSVLVEGRSCVVVDPGALVADQVVALVAERGLAAHGVLLTHGHVDHTWDAAEVAERLDVPVRLHAADAYRLADPFGTLGPLGGAAHDPAGPLAQALLAVGADPRTYRAPRDVRAFGSAVPPEDVDGRDADVRLELGELVVVARHAPGHTEGSTLYLLEADGPLAFTGDVLFAGTIGRTDLPGGDGARMHATLRDVVAALDPATVVVPGHGPTSTMAAELAGNPFLARA
ncbi:MBL fold metallo-hydrolase [Cellulomonas gilvus]|uniref:Beta-lactamase domain protein n=1 Tax=Cellulomonas gilvus (strain ATCC 13127 / NRRL B-14078) TaxID=593907 RepID=F8A4Z9_CELGA|nr:MBL fold metallo-hydrolase [Cellulomonas gilvus]AEI12102.1 beta-lactamase domain protein [Cellulomonas gilvus ATCC 13127]